MKKICFILFAFFLCFSISSISVEADDLEDISFKVEPIIGDQKRLHLEFSFAVTKEIIFLQIDSTLHNHQEERFYETGRDNIASLTVKFQDDKYVYTLNHKINYWQIGTMKLDLSYSFIDNSQETRQMKTIYLSSGEWVDDQYDDTITKAIIYGILITLFSVAATFLIIFYNNKEKGIIKGEELE